MPPIPAAGGFGVGLPPDPLTLQGDGAVFLADAIDPQTGEYRSILKGLDPVDAAAIEAVRVQRASGSAVKDDGHKLHEIDVIDERLEFLATSEIKYAWRRLIEAKLIRLVSVKTQDDGDVGALLTVKYNNLFSGKSPTIPLPIEDRLAP